MNEKEEFHPDFLGEICRRIGLSAYPDTQQFVVQHLLPDTVRLLKILHRYVPIDTVIGISYSGNKESIKQLQDLGIRVLTPEYSELVSVVSSELANCIERCEQSKLRLVIHEVGGIAIKALHQSDFPEQNVVVGVLEITKQGVWEAQSIDTLKVPQLNVAETRIKSVEGKQVGEAIVAALDNILRDLGYSTVGRSALVLGYGWVGSGVARSLKNRGLSVSVKDVDSVRMVEAAVDGFTPLPRPISQTQAAIVVGATGKKSIDEAFLAAIPDRCFIVSGSSKNHEIDLMHLDQQTLESTQIHKLVRKCTLKSGKRVYLVNEGYPVNFTGASVPDEIVDLLFAELIMLVPRLLEDNLPPGIYTLPSDEESLPADVWLEMR